ncbi:extracellular serine-rich protein [Lasiosphaeria hispida]|uniref:Extracellular serine-rich protein n=1 Tax=Lasiosphaeria hispida TaxID=260671 RepID=A0AAJ0HSY3_9PEZI|nr:extracellular serine-rich protein [Lasiosphaeria hispida]
MLTSYITAAVVALAATASAQNSATLTATSSSARSTATGTPQIIEISVGALLHQFSPDNVTANVGDTIRFNFYPGGHRVARAEYKIPCIPYEYTGANKKGFWSGVFSPQTIQNPPPHYDVLVNDTEPIFFYCGAPASCTDYGMVGVINANQEKTLATQKEFAKNATLQLVPGEPFPSETAGATPTPSATSSPTGGNGGSTESNGAEPQAASAGLGAGAIAGIAIGAAAVILLGAALIYLCGRRGGFDKAYRKGTGASYSPPGAVPPTMAEPKFDPKSPGQATVSTFAQTAEHDPYRVSAPSPYAATFAGTPPPPVSPGMPGYNPYQNAMAPNQYPQHQQQHGYYAPQHSTPPPQHQQQYVAPVELPSSDHVPVSGNSPPPQYPNRDSWTVGSEGQYKSPTGNH